MACFVILKNFVILVKKQASVKRKCDRVEDEMKKNPYCQTRQDFIIGKLNEVMKKETRQGVLEIS